MKKARYIFIDSFDDSSYKSYVLGRLYKCDYRNILVIENKIYLVPHMNVDFNILLDELLINGFDNAKIVDSF